jgi:hypothetical protein
MNVPTGFVEDEAVLTVLRRRVSATPEDVARALSCAVAEARRRLSVLVGLGWLEFWPTPPGAPLRATLTPWAAERLGVRLDETSARWVPASAGHHQRRVRTKRDTVSFSELDVPVEDSDLSLDTRQLEPWEALAIAEAIERALAGDLAASVLDLDRLPQPSVLLGETIPWDGPEITAERPRCRTCGGRPLRPHEFCLRCDNWGLDRLRRRRRRSARPRAASSSAHPTGADPGTGTGLASPAPRAIRPPGPAWSQSPFSTKPGSLGLVGRNEFRS